MNRRAGIFVLIASALASCAVLLITVLYRHGGRAKNAPIVNGSEARPLKANDGAIQWPSGPLSEAGLIQFEDNNIEVGSIEVDGNLADKWSQNIDSASPIGMLISRVKKTGTGQSVLKRVVRRRQDILRLPPDPDSDLLAKNLTLELYAQPEMDYTTVFPVICRPSGCEIQVLDIGRESNTSINLPPMMERIMKSAAIRDRLDGVTVTSITLDGLPAHIAYFTPRKSAPSQQ
jgi:hypothetical protein